MKNFTTEEIRDLFNRVMIGEISFPEMVEVLNERVEEPRLKEGDFVKDVRYGAICIYHDTSDNGCMVSHAGYNNGYTTTKTGTGWGYTKEFRHATETEKQELLDALAKKGKRWNAEKLCVEDIPKCKFKVGDRVRIKDGISSKTVHGNRPSFHPSMDDFIGITMTVNRYSDMCGYVVCNESGWRFLEDWLEPYVEELKKGDLAIFWDNEKKIAVIKSYDRSIGSEEDYFLHKDQNGFRWRNAIKFESKEQFEKLIKGEI